MGQRVCFLSGEALSRGGLPSRGLARLRHERGGIFSNERAVRRARTHQDLQRPLRLATLPSWRSRPWRELPERGSPVRRSGRSTTTTEWVVRKQLSHATGGPAASYHRLHPSGPF